MDITSLLAPISTDRPGGADLSYSAEIDAIQEMRREDDPTLDQGAWVAALKAADWAGVARACETLLTTTSKDLRVVGWLVDAWARAGGFERLADGLELAAGLVETLWDNLHPQPDDGDQEARIGNLRWLAGRVEQLAPSIPLVVHGTRRTSFAAVQGARARRLAAHVGANGSPPSTPGPAGEPALTLEMIGRDVSASGREAARHRRAQVVRAQAALIRLQVAVDARLQDDAPSFSAARASIDKVLDELGRLDREAGFDGAAAPQTAASDRRGAPAVQTTPQAVPAVPLQRLPGQIDSRAQALEQLRLVADFFRASEPHSPVAYLADKAVLWSEMPLHEWLRAVVKDGVSLAHLEELLGVDKSDAGAP